MHAQVPRRPARPPQPAARRIARRRRAAHAVRTLLCAALGLLALPAGAMPALQSGLDNRDMSTDCLRAALELPMRPAMHGRVVLTVDRLLLDGLASLLTDPVRFFARIDVPEYSRHFLAEVARTLDEIGRSDLARGVEAVSRALHGAVEPEV